jgi:hypothetical protein
MGVRLAENSEFVTAICTWQNAEISGYFLTRILRRTHSKTPCVTPGHWAKSCDESCRSKGTLRTHFEA